MSAYLQGFEQGQRIVKGMVDSYSQAKLKRQLKEAGDQSQYTVEETEYDIPKNRAEQKARIPDAEREANELRQGLGLIEAPAPEAPKAPANGLGMPTQGESFDGAPKVEMPETAAQVAGIPQRSRPLSVEAAAQEPRRMTAPDPMAEVKAIKAQARLLRDNGMIAESGALMNQAKEVEADTLRQASKSMFQKIQAGDYKGLVTDYNKFISDGMEVVSMEPGEGGVTITAIDKVTGQVSVTPMSNFQLQSMTVGMGQDPYKLMKDMEADKAARIQAQRQFQKDERDYDLKLSKMGLDFEKLQAQVGYWNGQLKNAANRNAIYAADVNNKVSERQSREKVAQRDPFFSAIWSEVNAADRPRFFELVQSGMPSPIAGALIDQKDKLEAVFVPGGKDKDGVVRPGYQAVRVPGFSQPVAVQDSFSIIDMKGVKPRDADRQKAAVVQTAFEYVKQKVPGLGATSFRQMSEKEQADILNAHGVNIPPSQFLKYIAEKDTKAPEFTKNLGPALSAMQNVKPGSATDTNPFLNARAQLASGVGGAVREGLSSIRPPSFNEAAGVALSPFRMAGAVDDARTNAIDRLTSQAKGLPQAR